MITNSEPLKRTPLYDAHVKAGAKLVEFGGWEMPVQYAGLKSEHEAVRSGVAVFDVSHMGEFCVSGVDALRFLQYATTNDVSKLKAGKAQYNWLPNLTGGLVDDIYIYMNAENDYLVVVNAGNIQKDWQHLNELAKDFNIQLKDESDKWALMAVQGKKSEEILNEYVSADLSNKKKNSYFNTEIFGIKVRLARTGYTGEDGFEIFCEASEAEYIWNKLMEIGVRPAGLGARDTLRLEAGFPLYGHEFSEEIHPLSSHYAWVVKEKHFYGVHAMRLPPRQKLIGLKLDKIPAREGYAVKIGDIKVGSVTSGSTSPSLGYPIAMALVSTDYADESSFFVEVRGKDYEASKTEIPFYLQGAGGKL